MESENIRMRKGNEKGKAGKLARCSREGRVLIDQQKEEGYILACVGTFWSS